MSKIRAEWILAPDVIQQAKKERSIAGAFIESILDPDTRAITRHDVPTLMEMTCNGSLSAVRLTTAFCKRAAYGYQLVLFGPL